MTQFLIALAALAFVIALIFITAALGRWINPWLSNHLNKRVARPSFIAGISCQIDAKRRVHLAELEGQKFLVLTGGPNDVMIMLAQGSMKDLHQ
jgi:O-succinylbenzoate synthase